MYAVQCQGDKKHRRFSLMKTTMTNELPAEIMENGIHYTLVGDYYLYAGG